MDSLNNKFKEILAGEVEDEIEHIVRKKLINAVVEFLLKDYYEGDNEKERILQRHEKDTR